MMIRDYPRRILFRPAEITPHQARLASRSLLLKLRGLIDRRSRHAMPSARRIEADDIVISSDERASHFDRS